ncbi:hypothetical protein C8R42DRAFT_644651 [Lentinula raphanica]|nr:hypothetical protein C8R42DRAFT_644651 [Lentinula raphanica]
MQEFRSSWIPPGLEVTGTPPATPTKLEEENLSMNADDMIQLAKQVVQEQDEATVRADAAQAELYHLRKLMMAVGEDLHGLATAMSGDEPVARKKSWMHLVEVAEALTSAGRNGSAYKEQSERRLRRLNPMYKSQSGPADEL